ncbi:cytochrome c3 family protein [Planctomicrobium sp. SH527]|uniref:cytochrome c3 family protein n=1 Tax=Planctomicrobium sp. SH527 TaxID=3448123 RepID=UPI003F5B6E15
MPQIFHPSMNVIARVGIFGAIFLVTSLVGGVWGFVRSPYMTEQGIARPQPIPFSHAHHVGDLGIDCRYCHTQVETEAMAGVPATEVCMNCHSQLWNDTPMIAPLLASVRENKPIEWRRVHDAPDYVFFHHGVHIAKGIACETCHGRVDKMPLMWRENTLHMQWCLECHNSPDKNLRPVEDVFAMGWKPKESTPTTAELTLAGHVRSQTNCSVCHR